MPKVSATKRVAVPADVAYAVAADVKSYDKFLPLLKQVNIRGPVDEQNAVTRFKAELLIRYKKLNIDESFVSSVVCDEPAHIVTASSSEAPFKSMRTEWVIREAGGHADVTVKVEYSLRNLLLQIAAGAAMGPVVDKIMSAFEARALEVYSLSKTS